MYYLCKRFQGEIELLIAKFQKQGRSLAKGFCHQKKEFFEKIYINREVVQEASVWFYIKWMGKRNEPINSLSLLLRHRLKTIKEQKKRCFLLDTFRISVLKQRLLGEAFGLKWYPLSFITHHLSPKHILQWRVWSWLRMNASYRLNTCKSRGNDIEACFDGRRPAHGWVTRIQPASD